MGTSSTHTLVEWTVQFASGRPSVCCYNALDCALCTLCTGHGTSMECVIFSVLEQCAGCMLCAGLCALFWAGCGFLMHRKHALAVACAPSQHHHHNHIESSRKIIPIVIVFGDQISPTEHFCAFFVGSFAIFKPKCQKRIKRTK